MLSRNFTQLTCYLFLVPCCIAFLVSGCSKPDDPFSFGSTKASHDTVNSYDANAEIPISSTISGDTKIEEVRLYFKPMTSQNYFYVTMIKGVEDKYSGYIPPIAPSMKGVDYFLLVKTADVAAKTKSRRILVLKNYVPRFSAKSYAVYSETPLPRRPPEGFATPLTVLKGKGNYAKTAAEFTEPPLGERKVGGKSYFLGGPGASFSLQIGGLGVSYH